MRPYVTERFVLAEQTKRMLRSMGPKFGYGQFSEFIFYKHYSRPKSEGVMESWADVIIRVTEGTMSIRKDHMVRNSLEWNEFEMQHYAVGFALSMFNMHWLPPGRGMWAMGTEFVYTRGALPLYNCAFTNISDFIGDDIHWAMDCLMNGVGVGAEPIPSDSLQVYTPENAYEVYQWDTFKDTPYPNSPAIVIEDSREGWCDSTKTLIDAFLVKGAKMPVFDYSRIRLAGEPIMGFGGIASGPGPLKALHSRIMYYMGQYIKDSMYDSVMLKADIINAVGVCVVSGNVRRSAEILTGSIDDEVFLDLKNYDVNPHRADVGWMSNNSVNLDSPEDFEKLGEIAARVVKNGEPGFINRMNFKYGRVNKNDSAKIDYATGINPCQPSWAKVLTPEGIRTIGQIKIGDQIWSENKWVEVIKKWSTGVNNVYAYRTSVGTFYGTKNHRLVSHGQKIEAQYACDVDSLIGPLAYKNIGPLDPQDILEGLYLGDGTDHYGRQVLNIGRDDQDYFDSEVSHLIGASYNKPTQFIVNTKIHNLPVTYLRSVRQQTEQGSPTKIAGFLRGLYSANGSVVRGRVALKASSFAVIESVQRMLSSIGIRSYYTSDEEKEVQFENGTYTCRKSWNLQISVDRKIFYDKIGFIQEYKMEKLEDAVKTIGTVGKSVQKKSTHDIYEEVFISREETWDITVSGASHTYWTDGLNVSNCGEIPLESKEVCNVVETFPTCCRGNNGQLDPKLWYNACKYATFYTSTVSLLPTHRNETNKVVAKNRRIGVSLVDFTGWKHEVGLNKVIAYLRKGYEAVCSTNRWANAEAGVPEAIRKTTVKPGGTIPKIPGKTSGAGYPTFIWTIRRVRVSKYQPIFPLLVKAGVPYEPEVNDPENTFVFEFPIKQGPAKPAEDISLWEQASNLVTLQREWADNAVSNTLYFKPKWILVKHLWSESDLAEAETLVDKYGFCLDAVSFEEETTFTKIQVVRNENRKVVDIKLYRNNPKHEENDIESVISSIAPSVKSVSLLPHTAKGVYAQMPEEGITEEEYNKRISEIAYINWSDLKESIPEAELYCEGDKCQITQAP